MTLTAPSRARITHPDPRIDALRGTVAIERGPLVYALESTDLGRAINDVVLLDEVALQDDGPHDVRVAIATREAQTGSPLPYGSAVTETTFIDTVRLVPYSTWGNRGPSTMRVFLPTE